MTLPRLLVGTLVAALLCVGPAAGLPAVLSGDATLTGSGTSYQLRLTNTGTEPIRCWRLTLPAGVMATAIGTPPAGWQVGAAGPPPQPVLGGQGAAGLSPGATAVFPFTTDGGFPPGLTSTLRISGDCKTDTGATVTGPTAGGGPPTPTPTPTPCACSKLTASVDDDGFAFTGRLNEKGMRLELRLRWVLRCTAGTGSCRGSLALKTSSDGARLARAGGGRGGLQIGCKGACSRSTPGVARFVVLGGERYGYGNRSVLQGRLSLTATATCRGRTVRRHFTIVFARDDGRVSLTASDLDGDGKADGRG